MPFIHHKLEMVNSVSTLCGLSFVMVAMWTRFICVYIYIYIKIRPSSPILRDILLRGLSYTVHTLVFITPLLPGCCRLSDKNTGRLSQESWSNFQ